MLLVCKMKLRHSFFYINFIAGNIKKSVSFLFLDKNLLVETNGVQQQSGLPVEATVPP